MSVVWLVSGSRFLQEYETHIKIIPRKYVNWTIDSMTGYVRMYISGTNSNDIFCYIHEGPENTLPIELSSIIERKGYILGTIDLSDKNEELTKLSRDMRFNMVNQG